MYISYGISVLGQTPKTNLSKLLTLQKIVVLIDFIDKIENAVIYFFKKLNYLLHAAIDADWLVFMFNERTDTYM